MGSLSRQSPIDLEAASGQICPTVGPPQIERVKLANRQIQSLDRDGYLVLDGVLDSGSVQSLKAELDRLASCEGPYAVNPDPTGFQLWLERRQGPVLGAVLRAGLRRTMSFLRWGTERFIFRHRPHWKLKLREAHGSPGFGLPQGARRSSPRRRGWLSKLVEELRGQLTVASFTEGGVTRVCNLLNKSDRFDRMLDEPRVLAAVRCLLGDDWKLSSINGRNCLPGFGLQPLHTDWEVPPEGGRCMALNTLWVLDDFRPDNGATRVVPGTHRSGQLPEQVLENPRAEHPEQRLFDAKAGSVIVMNAHTWHGGTLNRSGHSRRIVQVYFVRRAEAQQLNQAQHLRPSTRTRLTPQQLASLGLDCHPPASGLTTKTVVR